MFNSIFGSAAQAHAAQSMFGTGIYNHQGMANQGQNMFAQQQAIAHAQNQYNAMRNKPQFVFNGIEFNTVEQLADFLFPDDTEMKFMFLLKHGGK